MVPRYPNPMQNRMMPRHFPQSMGRPPVNHMRRMAPQMQQRGGGGGGLLSKILRKGNTANTGQAMNHASRALGATNPASGGGLLKSLANPTALNGFLTNTQKVLSTAQQVGPLVEQYGPIVKNLPAMWRLYRGLKNAPELNEKNEEESSTTKNDVSFENDNESERKESRLQESNQEDQKSNRNQSLPSRPKLYI